MQCQSWAHRYVGKGADRVLYEGPCVLERGHDDLDHLPAGLAQKQVEDRTWNAALDAVMDRVSAIDVPDTGMEMAGMVAAAVQQVRRG